VVMDEPENTLFVYFIERRLPYVYVNVIKSLQGFHKLFDIFVLFHERHLNYSCLGACRGRVRCALTFLRILLASFFSTRSDSWGSFISLLLDCASTFWLIPSTCSFRTRSDL